MNQQPRSAVRLMLLFAVLGFVSRARAADAPRPNIVYILSDDHGWADVGFHHGEIPTPNIDSIAAAGARLEQFYVQPLCSPTRACLMTGRYPMRYGFQVGVVKPHAQYGLPLDERTLPQALKEVGYETAIVGKWHLGHFQRDYLPTHRGFDHQYGHYNGALDYFTHMRDGGLDWHRDDKPLVEEGYSTFLDAKEAVRLINNRDRNKPLFLYVPFNAVHAPHQVPEKYKEPYTSMPEPRRTYAGMVAAEDEAIGTILHALDAAGMRDNTLILFSSDNGGPAPGKVTSNGPLRAGKGTLYEGGTRVCAAAAWPGHIKPGSEVNAPMHMVDWYPTLLKLAGASLEQKHPLDGKDAWAVITQGAPSAHDEILLNATPQTGAIRVGDWKLVINGQLHDNGEADEANPAAGAKAKGKGKKKGGKKAVGEAGETVELFNLADDPYEKKNLAAENPEKAKELRSRYDAIASQAVPPKSAPPAPGYHPPKIWGEPEE